MPSNKSNLIYWDTDPYKFFVGNIPVHRRKHSEKDHFNEYKQALSNGVCNWDFINK